MRENVKSQRKFAGNHAIDKSSCTHAGKTCYLLLRQLLEIVTRFFITPFQAKIGDEKGGAAGAAEVPDHFAFPAGIEQVLVCFRNLVLRHELRIVTDAVKANARRRPERI